jgi:hypothetical protein
VTSADAAVPLYQVGDGPISFDRSMVERNAFFAAKPDYYSEETVQGEPLKGNFSNVARVRSTGALLGPTNHHGYQPALRKLYEERYSRRMSFPEFQQSEIEIVTDEQAVADWKEQARSTTTYATTKEETPVTFKTLFDAEQHFRKHYLPTIVKSGQTLECSGQAARAGGDRHVGSAVRQAWEAESRFPHQIVNGLRPFLMEAGLHFFKHRKRILFVTATKPQRHPVGQVFSEGVTAILKTVEASPRIKRPELAAKILGETQDTPEATARKSQLAQDLHYLIHEGQVIEFSDGALELPLAPQDKSQQQPQQGKKPAAQAGGGAPPAVKAAAAEAGAAEASSEAEAEAEGAGAEEAGADDDETVAEEAAPLVEAEPAEAQEAQVEEAAAPGDATVAVDAEPKTVASVEAEPAVETSAESIEETAEPVAPSGEVPAEENHTR